MKSLYVEGPVKIHDKEFLTNVIKNEGGEKVLKFISEQVDLTRDRTTVLLSSSSSNDNIYVSASSDQIRTIIDLQAINWQNNLNSYFGSVNSTLPDAGIYIGCVESIDERHNRLSSTYPKLIMKAVNAGDFLVHRVLPKLPWTKNIYNVFSRDKCKVFSKAEILGRLSYNGFEIIGIERINNLMYFSVIKTSEPKVDKNPSYGILIKMNRVSKAGKFIGVYKIRTMHPYSEYLQDYVVKMNGYNKVGKPEGDFRLTSWGKVIRKLHLDEIPQLLNVLKGELNIVGVRPLSRFGFESLPLDLQKERIRVTPGCIPPSVSLGMSGFDGVIKAERIYLNEMRKNGLIINAKYFCKAIYNLLVKRTLSA